MFLVVMNNESHNVAAHIHSVTLTVPDNAYTTKPHYPLGLNAAKHSGVNMVTLGWEHVVEGNPLYRQFEATSYTVCRKSAVSEIIIAIGSVSAMVDG